MEQRSQEWFDARKGKITGSRIGGILGVNQYKTPDETMREMVREHFDAEREFTGNEATDHGEKYEPVALDAYKKRTGYTVDEVGFIAHAEYDFIGASPDGLIGFDGGVEFKCPFYAREPYSVFDANKASYLAQCRLVMEVCHLQWIDFYCYKVFLNKDGELDRRRQPKIILDRVKYDPEWWPSVLPTLLKFRAEYERTIADKALYQRHLDPLGNGAPEEIFDPRMEELAKLFEKIAASKEEMKPVIAEFDKLRKELGQEFGSVSGFGIEIKRVEKRGQVDNKAVHEHLKVQELLRREGKALDDFRKAGSVSYEVSASA